MSGHGEEVAGKGRFEFGENWSRFLSVLDERRIQEAEKSLREMLGETALTGKRFLDAGSGSGLFSLAARRMGARVRSFDYDPRSVACTAELKRRYFPDDPDWSVEEGSVLDKGYMKGLGRFDVVYSWGVLHHTGDMWRALENIINPVGAGGRLFISIYNDQGGTSRRWRAVKRLYNHLSPAMRSIVLCLAFVHIWGPAMLRDFLHGRPFHSWQSYKKNRGMSPWHDLRDWVGGYPFEVARPEEIFYFFKERGFLLDRMKTCGGGRGCNQFVFAAKDG